MFKNTITLILTVFSLFVFSQSFVGRWRNIDDETKKPKAIIEIYKKGDYYYGKIIELLIVPSNKNCTKCTDDRKNQALVGLEILREMSVNNKELVGGRILDPSKGKEYKCTISFQNNDRLKVRGYIGVSLIGRNQYWERVN